ncbi:MAG: DUF2177 family protein [Hyphomicrobiaceae bacterium]|nr:DUF2177 family protein [Hyphomicrobiaceae bacterium]
MKPFLSYLILAGIFLILDLIWLGLVANSFYRSALGPLMADQINVPAAVAFYLLYVVGVMVFVVSPALEAGGWWRALTMGAFFGLVAYGTYDLTNLAVTRGFPLSVALVDMAWGATLTAIAAALTVILTQRFVG